MAGSETRQRKKRLPVRCTDAELAAFKAAAETSGFDSVAAFIRLRALETSGPRPLSKLDRATLCLLLAELGKIGSNINQLARTANTSGNLPTADTLAEIRTELIAMRDAVVKALHRRDGD